MDKGKISRILECNIKSRFYKRILSTQLQDLSTENDRFVKEPFVLEFTGLPENYEYKESELKRAILRDMQKFFLDLVYYNDILECFAIIDLKTDNLAYQDIGEMGTA